MSYYPTPEGKDPHLWQVARRRASFRYSALTYLIVNAFLWILWALTSRNNYSGIPWPVWPTLGWGIGLAFQYFGAYGSPAGKDPAEAEYEKLQRQRDAGTKG
ncbi:2TM domain-containing protein [Flaviaesturariibacter amylovorans]|uniref:2TM domain-containing protein n=1 Tax=Flaviaesturariibacter amylovorans TaxID=1084520 RepID=A0ABP8G699_9BACT